MYRPSFHGQKLHILCLQLLPSLRILLLLLQLLLLLLHKIMPEEKCRLLFLHHFTPELLVVGVLVDEICFKFKL